MKLLSLLALFLGAAQAQRNNLMQQLMCAFNKNAPGCNGAQSDGAQVNLAATCPEQVDASEKCLIDQIMKSKNKSPQEKEQERRLREQVSRQITQCFVTRGCRDPVALMKGLGKCMKRAAMDEIVDPWGTCVSRQGFSLPRIIEEKMGKGSEDEDVEEGMGRGLGGGFGGRGRGRRGGKYDEMMEKLRSKLDVVCDPQRVSSREANAAFDCAVAAVEAAKARSPNGRTRGQNNMISMIGTFFSAMMECKKLIGQDRRGRDCQVYAKARKDAMCSCGQGLNEEQIKREMYGAWEECKEEQDVRREVFTEAERRDMEQKLSQAKGMLQKLCSFNF